MKKKVLFLLLSCILVGCVSKTIKSDDLNVLITEFKSENKIDQRVEVFSPKLVQEGESFRLEGEAMRVELLNQLVSELRAREKAIENKVRLLPDTTLLKNKVHAVINISVCNMRSSPNFTADMVSQSLLGTPVRVLDYQGWYRIQTPDGYIAWVHRTAISLKSREEVHSWLAKPMITVTEHYGFVRESPTEDSHPISDVVSGNQLALVGEKGNYFEVEYPDGRVGYLLKKMARKTKEWELGVELTPASITNQALSLKGIPYLWAGTSAKGVDCSGFVQLLYLLHDYILPRDASQQALIGELITTDRELTKLQEGDLLFFGEKGQEGSPDRISHVGIYLGSDEFIHAQGDVHISSLDSTATNFDEFNLKRLLFAKRIIPFYRNSETSKKSRNEFYYW